MRLRFLSGMLVAATCVVTQTWALPAVQTPGSTMQEAPLLVLPQDDVLPADLRTIYEQKEDIDQAMVVVEMGQKQENPQWLMSPTQLQVFLDTILQFMPDKPQPEDAIWPKLGRRDPDYKGMRVVLRTVYGKYFEPFAVFEGKVTTANGRVITPDYGRRMEYWMFGTSRVRRDQLVGAHVMPVLTFEQCRLLGQQIVETRPRQCLLPDNNLLLETNEQPTLESARIRDFEGCLTHGKALIYTFPRRCIAAGGRVFTEPPKVYEAPADAPLVSDSPFSLPVSMTVPTPTSVEGMGQGSPLQLNLNSELGGGVTGTPAGGL